MLGVGAFPAVKYLLNLPYRKVEVRNLNTEIFKQEEQQVYRNADCYTLVVNYEYTFNKEEHSSTRVALSQNLKFYNETKLRKLVDSLSDSKFCYVSARNPSFSFLKLRYTEGERSSTLSLLVVGVIMIVMAGYALVIK